MGESTFEPVGSWNDLYARFGDIRRFIKRDGTLSIEWEQLYIARIVLPEVTLFSGTFTPITHVTVHKALAEKAANLYAAIADAHLWHALGPYSGGYSFRANKNNGTAISLHAWGLAWDWDADAYPNGSSNRRDPLLVEIFERYGWRCGEDFHYPDPMHFSYSAPKAPIG